MSIERWAYAHDTQELYSNERGDWVQYEDHAELMADLQRRLDEAEARLADCATIQDALQLQLEQAEQDIQALEAALDDDIPF